MGVVKSGMRFLHDPTRVLLSDRDQFGDIVRYQVGTKNVVHLLSHPDHIEHVLLTNNRNYRKYTPHAMLTQEMGNGLLLNEGESWFSQRRLLQPAFQPRHFEGLSKSNLEAATQMLDRWEREYSNGQQIDLEREMSDLVRYTIGLTLMSTDLSEEIQAVLDSCGGKLSLLLGNLPIRVKNRRFRDAVNNLDQAIYDAIAKRRAAIEKGEELPSDILAMMLQTRDKDSGEVMSDRQLRDEIVTLLIAGYDTTSRTLTWSFYSLAKTPEVEARFHAEVQEVLNGRAPEYSDLSQLSYTSMIVQETLRLLPPNSIIGRQAVADDEIGGHFIPAGSLLTLAQYLTHRHTDWWENPEDFVPERFAPDATTGRHRFAYFPFGGGPRQCIGKGLAMMNITLTLATMAQRFKLKMVPGHEVKFGIEITLYPRGGLPMLLQRR